MHLDGKKLYNIILVKLLMIIIGGAHIYYNISDRRYYLNWLILYIVYTS